MRIFIVLLFSLAFVGLQAQNIDTLNSKVQFEVENLGFNTVEGSFSGIQGWAYLNPDAKKKNLLKVCLNASSISTGIKMRDKNLRGEDFFEVETYPNICFIGASYKYLGDNRWEVKGTLKIKDKEQEITVWIIQQNKALSCQFTIDRRYFGLGESYFNFTIGEEVVVKVRLQHRW